MPEFVLDTAWLLAAYCGKMSEGRTPKRSSNPRSFLTHDEALAVEAALEKAERATSAEIKVVFVRHSWGDLSRKARRIFTHLNLDKTTDRNGVLIILVVANRQFLIYGDIGIHRKVGRGFWGDVRDVMAQHFQNDAFGEGLCGGIARIGEKLATHFPWTSGDRNEIDNRIEYLR